MDKQRFHFNLFKDTQTTSTSNDGLTSISVKVKVRQRSNERGQGERESLVSVTSEETSSSSVQDDTLTSDVDSSVTSEVYEIPKVIGKVSTKFWEEQQKKVTF